MVSFLAKLVGLGQPDSDDESVDSWRVPSEPDDRGQFTGTFEGRRERELRKREVSMVNDIFEAEFGTRHAPVPHEFQSSMPPWKVPYGISMTAPQRLYEWGEPAPVVPHMRRRAPAPANIVSLKQLKPPSPQPQST